jgi:hypothetical protein
VKVNEDLPHDPDLRRLAGISLDRGEVVGHGQNIALVKGFVPIYGPGTPLWPGL